MNNYAYFTYNFGEFKKLESELIHTILKENFFVYISSFGQLFVHTVDKSLKIENVTHLYEFPNEGGIAITLDSEREINAYCLDGKFRRASAVVSLLGMKNSSSIYQTLSHNFLELCKGYPPKDIVSFSSSSK